MLKYPCLVLDHDDTVVQSEATINYPYFCYILDRFRPGKTITLDEYALGCHQLGFTQMCRQWYNFTDQELLDEYHGWQEYIIDHIPDAFDGIERIIRRQKAEGGMVCVVSHSCIQNITRDYAVHFSAAPDVIYGWDLPEEKRKPRAFPLQDIMEKYGFNPEEILVVDDMRPAYEMASKVGVQIAFAGWGRQNCPEIAREMRQLCDFSFDTVAQLEEFLFN